MKKLKLFAAFVFILLFSATLLYAETTEDAEAIIEQVISAEKAQMDTIRTITYDAEYIEGEYKDDGFKEKVRFIKKVYVKYLPDTSLMHEEFLEYYKDGELQEQKKLKSEAEDRIEKKKKRKAKDISFSMLEPFYPENSALYDISYIGIDNEEIEGYSCYHFKVNAKEEDEQLINGDFYFDVNTFFPVKVDFTPAKLVKKMMFKLNDMQLSIRYGYSPDSVWLPSQFDISGKGKAMFFIGVKFAGTEYYRNAEINSPEADKIFEELAHEQQSEN